MDPTHPERDPRQPPATFLESFDSLAQLLRQHDSQGGQPAGHHRAGPAEAHPYRPRLRPPLALLHVIDDGREEGETFRLRRDETIIGRTEGDITVPNDISMSPRHALIERLADRSWQLSDAGSAGGTFARVLKAKLHDGSELLLGGTRLRFEAAAPDEAWLVELPPHESGRRHECHAPVTTIGRIGCGCQVTIDDPFVSPVHAELRATPTGWKIENRGLNGLWVRIEAPVRLSQPSQFQCGEQRFVFVPLGE